MFSTTKHHRQPTMAVPGHAWRGDVYVLPIPTFIILALALFTGIAHRPLWYHNPVNRIIQGP